MVQEHWYTTWFNTPYYHLLYRHRSTEEAIAFIDALFKYLQPPPGATILDLACGKGRHSIYMASKGYHVTGLDLSEQNITQASAHAHKHLHFAVHDMRAPFRESAFDYVLNLFTSFGYFERDQENVATLRASHTNLKPKGKLLMDFMNVAYVASHLVPEEVIDAEGVRFHISRKVERGMVVKCIDVLDCGHIHHFQERVRAFTRQDFTSMLHQAGFDLLDVFGDYHLGAFDERTSPRLILLSQKTT